MLVNKVVVEVETSCIETLSSFVGMVAEVVVQTILDNRAGIVVVMVGEVAVLASSGGTFVDVVGGIVVNCWKTVVEVGALPFYHSVAVVGACWHYRSNLVGTSIAGVVFELLVVPNYHPLEIL